MYNECIMTIHNCFISTVHASPVYWKSVILDWLVENASLWGPAPHDICFRHPVPGSSSGHRSFGRRIALLGNASAGN